MANKTSFKADTRDWIDRIEYRCLMDQIGTKNFYLQSNVDLCQDRVERSGRLVGRVEKVE